MTARHSYSIFVSLIVSLLFTYALLFALVPTNVYARTLIWEEPTTKYNGVPLFWRFFKGYIAYYNLNGISASDITLPEDAEVIFAYTSKNDPIIDTINTNNIPVVYKGSYFWFYPSLSRAYNLMLTFSRNLILYESVYTLGGYTSYWNLGIRSVPNKIVVIHKTDYCNQLNLWMRWWKPCAPSKPVTYFFETFDWPGRSGATARNIKIRYSATVTDADSGEIIQNGATVPTGTRLRLSFTDHQNSDITWAGSKHWRYLLSYLRMRHGWGYWGWWIWREQTFWNLYPRFNSGVWVENGELPNATCRDEDLIFTDRIWRYNRYLLGNILNYVTIAVKKPSHTLKGTENFNCEQEGADTICTMDAEGDSIFNFVFGESNLNAYHSYKRPKYNNWSWGGFDTCLGVNDPMYKRNASYSVSSNCSEYGRCWNDSSRSYYNYSFSYKQGEDSPNTPYYFTPFEITVPEQTISYSISVENQNSAPNIPTVTGDENILLGDTATFQITGTDVDADTIRYGIDWGEDGKVDQWLPESGYTLSSTTISTSYTWGENGEMKFKVLSEDANDARSDWTEFTINILKEPTLEFGAKDYLIPKNTTAFLEWSSEYANSCSASGAWSGTKSEDSSQRTETLTEFQNEYTLTCSNALASTTSTLSVYTYSCGDNVCTSGVETCSTCSTDCGACGAEQSAKWDVFLDLTEDPPQVRYGGGVDEVGN